MKTCTIILEGGPRCGKVAAYEYRNTDIDGKIWVAKLLCDEHYKVFARHFPPNHCFRIGHIEDNALSYLEALESAN